MNKVRGIYISFPWFRFTHMDLALRVLFHGFQIIFDQIQLIFSVKSTVTNAITAVSTVNILKPRQSCSWTYKINKLLVSPNEWTNEHLNIILERTFEYKRIQRYLCWVQGTWKERPKSTWPAHVQTCLSQAITCLSYSTSLLAVSIVNNNAVTCPAKTKRGGHFGVLTGMWVFQNVTLHRVTNSAVTGQN